MAVLVDDAGQERRYFEERDVVMEHINRLLNLTEGSEIKSISCKLTSIVRFSTAQF